jgi:1-deoxy-D-xylulose-5-phosphate synthase
MATQNIIPVVAIYSTFLQRAFDQIIHDVALQKLHVVFVLDRAGLVGADGPTHHGAFDLSFLRVIPGMVVMAPKDESELRDMLYTAVNYKKGPIALRYPRGSVIGVPVQEGFNIIEIGKSEVIKKGFDAAVIALGSMVNPAMKAVAALEQEGINCELINARFAKPLDVEMLDRIATSFGKIITIEENALTGGFGSAVLEYINEKGYKAELLRLGLPDNFIDHGTQEELHKLLGLDSEGIQNNIKIFYGTKKYEVTL